jgi:hypothetical protein
MVFWTLKISERFPVTEISQLNCKPFPFIGLNSASIFAVIIAKIKLQEKK